MRSAKTRQKREIRARIEDRGWNLNLSPFSPLENSLRSPCPQWAAAMKCNLNRRTIRGIVEIRRTQNCHGRSAIAWRVNENSILSPLFCNQEFSFVAFCCKNSLIKKIEGEEGREKKEGKGKKEIFKLSPSVRFKIRKSSSSLMFRVIF